MKRSFSRLLAAVAVGTAVVATATPAFAGAPNTNSPNNRVDQVRGGGSDTTYNLMAELGAHYNASYGCIVEQAGVSNNDQSCRDFDAGTPGVQPEYLNGIGEANADHDVVWNYYPVGSSNGIRILSNRGTAGYSTLDYARSSRAPKSSDIDGLRFLAFAKDALPWVKFPGAPAAAVNDLSRQDLKDIWVNCTITDWGQVGGVSGEPIVVWTAQGGSGTRATWDGFLGSGANSENCIPAQFKDGSVANGERAIFENDATPIVNSDANDCSGYGSTGVGAAPLSGAFPCQANSIFPYSYGRWNQNGGETSIMGSIDGVAPTEQNILDGTYPHARYVYNVIRHSAPITTSRANAATRDFLDYDGFICKRNSQHATNPYTGENYGAEVRDLISAEGFLPLPQGATGGGGSGNGYSGHCRVTDTVNV